MNLLNKIAVAAMFGAASVSGAVAADLVTEPVMSAAEPIAYSDPGFDWSGFYAGVFGSVQSTPTGWAYGPGVVVGANAQLDYFLIGGELGFSGITNSISGRTYAQGLLRAGVVVTDEILLYSALGYGFDASAAPDEHVLVGAGLEAAVAENISLKGQYLYGIPATAASAPINQFSVGVNFHF